MITTDGQPLSIDTKVIRIETVYERMSKQELLEELKAIINMMPGNDYTGDEMISDIHDSLFNQ